MEVGFSSHLHQGSVCLESKHWSPAVLSLPLTGQIRGYHGSEAKADLTFTLNDSVASDQSLLPRCISSNAEWRF